jgi:hypothetical protein
MNRFILLYFLPFSSRRNEKRDSFYTAKCVSSRWKRSHLVDGGGLGFVQVLRGKKMKLEHRTLHIKLARSHLSILFFFSYRFKCSRHKKAKSNIRYRITLQSPQEEKSGTLPHATAACALPSPSLLPPPAARRPPHAPRPPPLAARCPPPAARQMQSRTLPSPYRTSAHLPYP